MAHEGGRPGRPSPLTVLTHNVGGITDATKAHKLMRAWHRAGAHIVSIQETWVGRVGQAGQPQAQVQHWLSQAAEQLRVPQPQMLFANNTQAASTGRAGVAVLLLRPVVLSAQVHIELGTTTPDGRCMQCRIQWAGHDFTMLNTYWPNDHSAQAVFLRQVLSPLFARIKGSLMLTGDFNHVVDAELDRTRLAADGAVLNAGRREEQQLAADLAAALQTRGHPMVDVFRHRHPAARGYTRFQGGSASRIDRIYAPAAMQPYLLQCAVCIRVSGSDHMPLKLVLSPQRLDGRRGRGTWRANVAFLQEPERRGALASWAAMMVRQGLDMTPAELLGWWPQLKAAYTKIIKGHMAEYSDQMSAQPSERVAEREMEAAMQEVWDAGEGAQLACLGITPARAASARSSSQVTGGANSPRVSRHGSSHTAGAVAAPARGPRPRAHQAHAATPVRGTHDSAAQPSRGPGYRA